MGAGAWGTALAKVLADAGDDVTLWARRPEVADEINDTRRNTDYLGDVELPAGIHATGDAADGAGRRVHGAAGRAVADAAGEPRAVARTGRRGRHAGERGQGHRTGHADADEPGDHRRSPVSTRPGSR